jgi:hypothetical protein
MATVKRRAKTYACKKVLLSCGAHSVSGYAEDSFVSIEPNGEGVKKSVGCDGEVNRSLDPDNTNKLKVTLQQTSDSVGFFQRMYDMDQETGQGVLPVLLTDLMGGVLFQSDEMWVAQDPSRNYGKVAGTIEIQLDGGEGKVTDS